MVLEAGLVMALDINPVGSSKAICNLKNTFRSRGGSEKVGSHKLMVNIIRMRRWRLVMVLNREIVNDSVDLDSFWCNVSPSHLSHSLAHTKLANCTTTTNDGVDEVGAGW